MIKIEKLKNNPLSVKKINEEYFNFLITLNKQSKDTKGTYTRALREFFRWLDGKSNFKFTKIEIEKYKNYLVDEKKLALASIATYLTSLRKFFNYLVSKNILKFNPANYVQSEYRGQIHTRDILNQIEIFKLLKSVKKNHEGGYRDFAILKLMSSNGLSEIEITRANVNDLKNRKGQSAILHVQGKNEKDKTRFVMLSKDVLESIKNYLVFRFNLIGDEPLFQTAGNRIKGKRMSTRSVRERVTFHLKNAGLLSNERKITPLSLRHSAISAMVKSGHSILEIQNKFRIKNKATVMIYIKKLKKDEAKF